MLCCIVRCRLCWNALSASCFSVIRTLACHPERSEGSATSWSFRFKCKASALRACHFCFGKSNQNHLRRTLADAMKPHRFPVLLAGNGTARNSLRSNIRASLAASSCGARLALKALKINSHATAKAKQRPGRSNSNGKRSGLLLFLLLMLLLSNPRKARRRDEDKTRRAAHRDVLRFWKGQDAPSKNPASHSEPTRSVGVPPGVC